MRAAFVARFSPWRLIFLILLCFGFMAISLMLLGVFGDGSRHGLGWSGWIGLAFFGPAAAILIRRVSDRRPQIVVDHRGLYWRQWSDEIIPWREFESVAVHQVNRQKLLSLSLRDPEAHPPTTPLGKLARYNEALGFAHVTLSAQGLDCSFDQLHEAILARLKRSER